MSALLSLIRSTFPATPFFGPVTACDCEECKGIAEALRHKTWQDVPASFIDATCSPTLLTPEAYRAFLPAYMVRALEFLADENNLVVEFTVYSMSAHNAEEQPSEHALKKLQKCAALMSAEQIRTVRTFLHFVSTHAANAEWLREFIEPALTSIWCDVN